MKICIDARMINSSGIGVFIKNILEGLVVKKKEWDFEILVDLKEKTRCDFLHEKNVHVIHCASPIYSICEQIKMCIRDRLYSMPYRQLASYRRHPIFKAKRK